MGRVLSTIFPKTSYLGSFFTLMFLVSLLGLVAAETAAPAQQNSIKDQQTQKSGAVNCFDYYRFGSVQVPLSSGVTEAVSGTTMTFTGKIVNENPYPIIDGAVYVKIFRKATNTQGAQAHGNDLVDQFFAKEGLNLKADSETDFSFNWAVPANSLPGEYQVTTFFVSQKKFNMLGLSFTDDIVGNSFSFSVSGESTAGVMLRKGTIKVNDINYQSASFIPKIAGNKPVIVSAALSNTTNAIQDVPVEWKVYSWDALLEENLVDSKKETVRLSPMETKRVQLEVEGSSRPVYFVVATAHHNDAKSIIGVRFARSDVQKARINFPGVMKYPFRKGEANTVFTCAHAMGPLPAVENASLRLDLVDAQGKTIHSYEYKGNVTGTMMGVRDDFAPAADYYDFTLKTSLRAGNETLDTAEVKYECEKINPGSCAKEGPAQRPPVTQPPEEPEKKADNTLATIVLVALILIGVAIYMMQKRKGAGKLFGVLIAFALLLVVVPDAQALSWNREISWQKQLEGFMNGSGGIVPNVTIWYYVDVKRDCTGQGSGCLETLPTSGEIPVGTKLIFTPREHAGQHIFWFGPGGYEDSPFGFWIPGAAQPTITSADKDYALSLITVDNQPLPNDPTQVRHFAISSYLSVNPPEKTIVHAHTQGPSGLTCTDNGRRCTVNLPGEITSKVTFRDTYGRFFFMDLRLQDTGVQWQTIDQVIAAFPTLFQKFLDSGGKLWRTLVAKNGVPAQCYVSASQYSPKCTELGINQLDADYLEVDYKTWYNANLGVNVPPLPDDMKAYDGFKVPLKEEVFIYRAVAGTIANNPPNPPKITGICKGYINSSYNFSLFSIDPDNDTLRYGVDWDDTDSSSAVNQWLPADGSNPAYVASGTTLQASKAWSTTGVKKFKALGQDSKLASSQWSAPFSITVADALPTGEPSNTSTISMRESLICADTGWSFGQPVSPSKIPYHRGNFLTWNAIPGATKYYVMRDDVTLTGGPGTCFSGRNGCVGGGQGKNTGNTNVPLLSGQSACAPPVQLSAWTMSNVAGSYIDGYYSAPGYLSLDHCYRVDGYNDAGALVARSGTIFQEGYADACGPSGYEVAPPSTTPTIGTTPPPTTEPPPPVITGTAPTDLSCTVKGTADPLDPANITWVVTTTGKVAGPFIFVWSGSEVTPITGTSTLTKKYTGTGTQTITATVSSTDGCFETSCTGQVEIPSGPCTPGVDCPGTGNTESCVINPPTQEIAVGGSANVTVSFSGFTDPQPGLADVSLTCAGAGSKETSPCTGSSCPAKCVNYASEGTFDVTGSVRGKVCMPAKVTVKPIGGPCTPGVDCPTTTLTCTLTTSPGMPITLLPIERDKEITFTVDTFRDGVSADIQSELSPGQSNITYGDGQTDPWPNIVPKAAKRHTYNLGGAPSINTTAKLTLKKSDGTEVICTAPVEIRPCTGRGCIRASDNFSIKIEPIPPTKLTYIIPEEIRLKVIIVKTGVTEGKVNYEVSQAFEDELPSVLQPKTFLEFKPIETKEFLMPIVQTNGRLKGNYTFSAKLIDPKPEESGDLLLDNIDTVTVLVTTPKKRAVPETDTLLVALIALMVIGIIGRKTAQQKS